MNILITGISGFVGEELYHFLNKKNKIIGIDKSKPEFEIKKKDKFHLCDITDFKKVKKVFDNYTIDHIIHCAALILEEKNINKVKSTNIYATEFLYKLSLEKKIKTFIYLSTFSIYEKNYNSKISEHTKPSCKNFYGKSKFRSEQKILGIKKISKTKSNLIIIRCPIIIGKKRSYRFALLFNLIKNHLNIPIIGDGKNFLSYIHVIDLCEAISKFQKRKVSGIFNIASTEPDNLNNIINYLTKKVVSKSKIFKINKFFGNLIFDLCSFFNVIPFTSYHKKIFNYNVVLSISNIQKKINWRPKYSVKQMLLENYIYYANHKPLETGTSMSKKNNNNIFINIISRMVSIF